MATTYYIGVYGSLRKGFFNHDRWGLDQCPLIKETTVVGAMFTVGGAYPKLYRRGVVPEMYENNHIVEIYEVPEYVYELITSMEEGAGYRVSKVSIDGVHNVHMYFARDDWKWSPEDHITVYA